jgi:hypothetical protein
MRNPNEPMLVVDFKLKDNKGMIKDCVVYEKDEKGQLPIQDKDKLNEVINSNSCILFQNRCVSGKTYLENIEEYLIKTILSSEF